jgi:hypothetical protein
MRQHSRFGFAGLDFETIIVEHNEGRPHRRLGSGIDGNPIVLPLTNQAGDNLIAVAVAICAARSRSRDLDVPDL